MNDLHLGHKIDLNTIDKALYSLQLLGFANSYGGVNAFLDRGFHLPVRMRFFKESIPSVSLARYCGNSTAMNWPGSSAVSNTSLAQSSSYYGASCGSVRCCL